MTTTLITGANKGLGYETARRLIEKGHTVYIGARDSERGNAAISMLTVQYAKALPDVKVNAVEPGFTATDLTGAYGFGGQPVADSAEVIVRVATIGKDGPTGTFQENGGELPW